MTKPLLELRDVRIDRDGCVLLESVSLVSSGNRVGLSGAARPVASAIFGDATVAEGEFLVSGVELERAKRDRLLGIARPWLDSPGERSTLTVGEGLRLSALLAGSGGKEAERRAREALDELGLSHLARHRLMPQPSVEQHLAGLAEAALFGSEVIALDWPIGLLSTEGWARYGTALSRLLANRRWIAWVSGPARLAVEGAWLGSLDQILHLDGALVAELGTAQPHFVRTLLVLEADPEALQEPLAALGLPLTPAKLGTSAGVKRAAFVVDLPSDHLGRPSTELVLAWSDEYQLPIVRLEPLELQC